MMRVLSIALLVAAAGCPRPAPPPPRPAEPTAGSGSAVAQPPPVDAGPPGALDRDLPRLATRATKLYQDVAAAFGTAGEDCAAATARITALQTEYADVVAANAKVLHDGRARELRAALEPHAEALDAAAKAIVDSKTMRKCSPDRAFADAFDKLVGSPP
jgi:hypothetical protein